MSYSVDFRNRVMGYLAEGHTQAEAKEVFKVGRTTIKEWKKLLSETGGLEPRELDRSARIYESEKLRTYIKNYPQATLKEIAEEFGGSISGAAEALKREKITFKKRHQHTASATKKNERNSMPR